MYAISMECHHRTVDLVTIATGVANFHSKKSREHLMNLWRTANLVHATAYHATDCKLHSDTRKFIYSIDTFIKPLSEAFGDEEEGCDLCCVCARFVWRLI